MLHALPFEVEIETRHIDCLIDPAGFAQFEEDFRPFIDNRDRIYRAIPGGETWADPEPSREKLLEYYLTLQAVPLSRKRVYLDGASCLSLFPNYLAETLGARVIRQDLFYPAGVHAVRFPETTGASADSAPPAAEGNGSASILCVGGPGESMPLDSNSVDVITLHCSFEHFEGDGDWRFAREALRLLRPKGRLFIIPFYCGDRHMEVNRTNFAPGCRFQRFYDAGTFRDRVLSRLDTVARLEIRYYQNVVDFGPEFYCHYSLTLVKEDSSER